MSKRATVARARHAHGWCTVNARACWWIGKNVGGLAMLVDWQCWWIGNVGGLAVLVDW